jgi:hypothetical protein
MMLRLLEIIKVMVYREMNWRIEYYDKTIAETLADFYLALKQKRLKVQQLIEFISDYKIEMTNEGKKVVFIGD